MYRHKIVETDYVRPYLYKSLHRKIHREISRLANQISDATLPFNELNSSDITAENALIQTELSEYQSARLHILLDRLSDRQWEAIHLKFYAELSNEEIADILNVNRQSVANLLHRGLTRLREDWPSLLSLLGFWLVNRVGGSFQL